MTAWTPLLSMLVVAGLCSAGPTQAAHADDAQLRQVAAQLQDLGATLRPQTRRASLPAGLQLAALTPPPGRANGTRTAAPAVALDAAPVAAPVAAPAAAPVAVPVAAPATALVAVPVTRAMAVPVVVPLAVVTPPAPLAAALAPQQVVAARLPAAAAAAPAERAAPVLLAAAPARTPTAAAPAEPRFDLSINNAPAAQVFLQIANGSAYNMLVSPEVAGTLSITLKDTTVTEAMDTIRELFGFEYRITGNRIFVYPNTVQTRLYRINYLPGRRQGASDIRVSSSAMTSNGNGNANGNGGNTSSGSSGNGGGATSGVGNRTDDNAHVRTTSDADFWREVQSSLAALVGNLGGRSVVLNPAAGVVVVKATPAELRQVENYLKAVQISIERQVMLEAKIVEVNLSKDAQTGINWAGFGKLGSGQVTFGSAAPGTRLGPTGNLIGDGNSIAAGADLAATALGRGFYGLAFQAANFAALLNFLQTQGDVQVLSSPRIATLNNQKAVLKVGSDELYVTGVSSSTTSSGTSQVTTPTLTLQPFFSGISLDVTPQIDESGNVMLHIHPTISTVTEKNKNIDLGSLGAFKLPLASSAVNETDSIVRVKDGQIVAIGGLMKQESRDERTGRPVVSEAPVVGGLFRQTSVITSKRELVIMLKPTVIHDDGVWPNAPSFGAPTAQPVSMAPAKP